MLDSQGRQIEAGQRVAYNLGGDVVPGVVLEVCGRHVKVRYEGHSKRWSGHVSKVRNPRGIFVISSEVLILSNEDPATALLRGRVTVNALRLAEAQKARLGR